MANLHQLLQTMIEKGASGPPHHDRFTASAEDRRKARSAQPSSSGGGRDETALLQYPDRRPEAQVRGEQRARSLLRFEGSFALPLQHLHAEGAVAAAIRTIPFKILTFEELGLPEIVNDLVKKPRGLVLVTGPTGSGKSTTLAAMIDKINNDRHEHIMTVEDPIEYLHQHKKCLVNQREVNADTTSFKAALKYVLRQDPDVVLIGEMRDLETIEAALTIAETGHLTFATLHTNSAAQTINRIVDVFPPHQQAQVRAQLSFVLEGVLSQQLLPKMSGRGRCLAIEVMVPNPAIRNLIREDKVHQIYSMMQTGQSKFGMQTMNQSLYDLYSRRLLSYEDTVGRSSIPDEIINMINRSGAGPAVQPAKEYKTLR